MNDFETKSEFIDTFNFEIQQLKTTCSQLSFEKLSKSDFLKSLDLRNKTNSATNCT